MPNGKVPIREFFFHPPRGPVELGFAMLTLGKQKDRTRAEGATTTNGGDDGPTDSGREPTGSSGGKDKGSSPPA